MLATTRNIAVTVGILFRDISQNPVQAQLKLFIENNKPVEGINRFFLRGYHSTSKS